MQLVRRMLSIILSGLIVYYVFVHNGGLLVPSESLQMQMHFRIHDLHIPDAINFRRPQIVDENLLSGPADSRLGFDAVVAVSAPNSNRRQHLIQAANVTEIDLTIPDLPQWEKHHIGNFTDKLDYGGRSAGRGSVQAWLSHTHVLRWFLDSPLQTMLVLEDDVDWDIRLRTMQIPRAAAAARRVLQPSVTYWGNTKQWDLIWLGHCGDWFQRLGDGVGPGHQHPDNLTSRPHMVYHDPSLLPRGEQHPFTSKLMDALELPEQTRAFHRSGFPLCTFGYAITRAGARKVLAKVAPVHRPESVAYDAALLLGCRRRGLRCFTVNPELFHHVQGSSLIVQEEKKKKKVFLPPVDQAGLKQTRARNETSNIECGFWSGHFRFNSTEQMEYLREEVGRKGRCLKPGRDDSPKAAPIVWEQ